MKEFKPLQVYSASAGSGKTFSLVQTYLKLTLGTGFNPSNFHHIIAMTFTNKAAWEMKERIIEALDLIAYENRPAEEISKRAAFINTTAKNLGLNSAELVDKAKVTLSLILHNYEDFNVLTIDKFSIRLVRTFARDLNLNNDFEVVLNEDEIIEQVIDELLSKIGTSGNEEITNLTLDYAKTNLDDGERWDFRSRLIEFAGVLKSEKHQAYIAEIMKEDYNDALLERLSADYDGFINQLEKERFNVIRIFDGLNPVPEDFPGKSRGIYAFIDKQIRETNFLKLLEPNATHLKALDGSSIKPEHNFPDELRDAILSLINLHVCLFEDLFIISNLKKNFHNLALLKYIANDLSEIKVRDNIIRISEFNSMIAELLAHENTNYIYERLGTKFKHYLLDEFQDTSRLQWLNLIPLVYDAISQDHFNLIVGDPKQAIYRFRNGLVQQFVALPEIYNPDNSEFISNTSGYFKTAGLKNSLKDNWRSKKEIVCFNNTLFKQIVKFLPNDFQSYYEDVEQNPMGKAGGLVELKKVNLKVLDENIEELEAQFIIDKIETCEKAGFKRGDICILTSKKKHGMRWAKVLTSLNPPYKVVSADSLEVSADHTVQLFIKYINLRKNKFNRYKQLQFAEAYFAQKEASVLEQLKPFWINKVGKLDFKAFVSHVFGEESVLFFDFENLYDLGQKFAALLGVSELNNPYLHHLMEMLHQYDTENGPDIRGFIEFWESNGAKETVQMPENDDAIQIMTVHKSKGLEFPVVILPSIKWNFRLLNKKTLINPQEGKVMYASLSKNNVPAFMSKAYDEEYDQNMLDYFNLLYVAFTRAADRLYLLFEEDQSNGSINGMFNLAFNTLIAENSLDFKVEENSGVGNYSYGEQNTYVAKENTISNNFYPKDIHDYLWFPEMSFQDADAIERQTQKGELIFGNQLHLILSELKQIDDLEELMSHLLKRDLLHLDLIDDLRKTVLNIFNMKEFKDLFLSAHTILNEQEVIIDENTVIRPDKVFIAEDKVVVVDYKTGTERGVHVNQVLKYISAFKQMGYEQVEGVIVYTQIPKFKPVKMDTLF